jgi:hypothetical protein
VDVGKLKPGVTSIAANLHIENTTPWGSGVHVREFAMIGVCARRDGRQRRLSS